MMDILAFLLRENSSKLVVTMLSGWLKSEIVRLSNKAAQLISEIHVNTVQFFLPFGFVRIQ